MGNKEERIQRHPLGFWNPVDLTIQTDLFKRSLWTRIWNLRKFVQIWHGGEITDIREDIILATEVGVEDQAKSIDR